MAGSEYYDHTTYPSQGASGSSSAMRSELDLVETGFGKLPDLVGNGGKITAINSGGTAIEAITTTGTGNGVRATSPTLESPILGTPTSGDATNLTNTIAPQTTAATSKATPVDADALPITDSAASNGLKKLTWANLKAGVFSAWGALINAGTGKTTPVDADALALMDSAASNATKTLTWANVKATLKTYFDGLYFSTGDIKDSLQTSAAGWVVMSGRTIGSAASGATERANADTEALYTLLWNNLTNTEAPVSTGRGASAAADFAANKTLTLPDARGRVLVGKDNMGGTTASRITSGGSGITGTTLGTAGGSETHTLTTAQIPSHDHNLGVVNSASDGTGAPRLSGAGENTLRVTYTTGGGGAHNNTQPSLVVNKFIKL